MHRIHTGWQKNYSQAHTRKAGGVCTKGMSIEGHFITPAMLPGCRYSYGELMGMAVINWGYGLSPIPTYCLRASSGFEYGTEV